jgi:hypothetical protein
VRDATGPRPGPISWISRIALAAVLIVCAIQIGWVSRSFLRLATGKVWANRHLDAVSRSADVAYGHDYMLYVQFLRDEIPEDAIVVLTRTDGQPQYDSSPFLQYFLIPRTVVDCPSGPMETCLLELGGPDVYFTYGRGALLPEATAAWLRIVPFDEDRGVLAPR